MVIGLVVIVVVYDVIARQLIAGYLKTNSSTSVMHCFPLSLDRYKLSGQAETKLL